MSMPSPTPLNAAGQRLPSTRPIDQRWDTSRGIIFSSAKRAALRAHTPPPSDSLVFGSHISTAASTSAQNKRFGAPTLGATSTAASSPSSLFNRSHAAPVFSSNPGDVQSLKSNVKSLEGKLLDAELAIKALKDENVGLETDNAELRKLMEETESARRDFQSLKGKLRHSEAMTEKEMEISAEKDVDIARLRGMQKQELAEKDAEIKRLVALQKKEEAEKDAEIKLLIRRQEEELARKDEEICSVVKSREAALDNKDAESRDIFEATELDRILFRDFKKNLREEAENVQLKLAAQETERTHAQTVKTLETESHGWQGTTESLQISTKRFEELNRHLEGQLERRKQRKETDWKYYPSLRNLYTQLANAVYELTPEFDAFEHDNLKKRQEEHELWTTSTQNFQNSSLLEPVRQQREFHGTMDAINFFLESKTGGFEAAKSKVEKLRNEVSADFKGFMSDAHASRTFTRYLQLDEAQTVFRDMNLALHLSVVQPIESQLSDCADRKEPIVRELHRPTPLTEFRKIELHDELNNLKTVESFLIRILMILQQLTNIEALKALLTGTALEKEMFVQSAPAKAIFRQSMSHYNIIKDCFSNTHLGAEDRRRQHEQFLENELKTIREFGMVESTIRRRVALQAELGLLDDNSEKMNDKETKNQIEMQSRAANAALQRLMPYKKRLLTRRDRSASQPARWKGSRSGSGLWMSSRTRRSRSLELSRSEATARMPPESFVQSPGGLNFKPSEPKQAQHSTPSSDLHSTNSELEEGAPSMSSERHSRDDAFDCVAPGIPQTFNLKASASVNEDHASQNSRSSYAPTSNEKHVDTIPVADSEARDIGSALTSYDTDAIAVADATASSQMAPGESGEEALVTLTYQIPAKDYREAVTVSRSSTAAYWSHKLYKNSSGHSPKVFYCSNFENAEKRAKEFLNESVVGFDIEWEMGSKPGISTIQRCVSLIQIAAEDKIGLFHIAVFKGDGVESLIPPSVRAILESPDILKAGVNVGGDATRIKNCLDVTMQGVLELSHLYKVVKFAREPQMINFKLVSLADQVQNVLLLPLKKDSVRTSMWSRSLNLQQTDYAAADAYAGFRLFHKLESERRMLDPRPPRPAFLESQQPLVLGNGDKVFKSASKPYESKKRIVAKAVISTGEEEDDDEEGEEYFDAIEATDTYGLSSSNRPVAATPDAALAESSLASGVTHIEDVTYPLLPQETLQNDSEQHNSLAVPAKVALEPEPVAIRPSRPETAETVLADKWADDWRASLPDNYKLVARPGELRAYHLWHEQNFSPHEVAALCKDPPLKLTTVASYILQAIKEENLPYKAERVKEVLEGIPRSVWGRYAKIVEKVGL